MVQVPGCDEQAKLRHTARPDGADMVHRRRNIRVEVDGPVGAGACNSSRAIWCARPRDRRKIRRWVDGLLTDTNGRPTGYAVHSEEESGKYKLVEVVPAERVWHLFEPQRPCQYRGISFLAPVLNALHDLDDLWKLEMEVAKLAGTLGIQDEFHGHFFHPFPHSGARKSRVAR